MACFRPARLLPNQFPDFIQQNSFHLLWLIALYIRTNQNK